MDHEDLRHWSKRAADWAADYHKNLRDKPVRPELVPGRVKSMLPQNAPENAEKIEDIWADFERLVPDAMTHWQHPRFFAYFPANASPASMLAEQVVNAISAQCMLWQTSPAATEIEEVMVGWLRDALGLPQHFTGTIHDTATTATLSAVLTMRERALDYKGLSQGLSQGPCVRIYASAETHSSIDKAARLSGIGQDNLIKIPTDASHALDPEALRRAIHEDKKAGLLPAGVIACAGGTSIGAFDRIGETLAVAKAEGLMTHVDAAWAGSAMICPEFRELWEGVENADSVVFNPHKWLGAQFDCAVQFMADPVPQIRTMGLRPDYLKTPGDDEIVNFNEWTVPLGRRFRALKLWFVLRAYGLDGLRQRIRDHVAWTTEAAAELAKDDRIEITTQPSLALFSFALKAGDQPTEGLLNRINDDGRVYLTQTRHQGRYVIRVSIGGWSTTHEDVTELCRLIREFIQ